MGQPFGCPIFSLAAVLVLVGILIGVLVAVLILVLVGILIIVLVGIAVVLILVIHFISSKALFLTALP